jgi:N-acetyl sugar amidotransferase
MVLKDKSLFGLPSEIKFCKKCVESNQRFLSSTQHKITASEKKETIYFNEQGICSACNYYENKSKVDWSEREKELREILDQHRSLDGSYDVLVPGSGGKDSIFTSFLLKKKYNMNPLTCTWSPGEYTDIGWKNYRSWINSGFDNILFTPNKKIHGLLTRIAFENILHPFQPFALGQNSFPLKVAIQNKIKLVIYGDGNEERASGKSDSKMVNKDLKLYNFHYHEKNDDIFLGGIEINEMISRYKISKNDLLPFLPIAKEQILDTKLEVLPITKFINYNPQDNFYFAKENSNFQVNPDGRSEGTYTKYSSLDDKFDGFHYYTWFIKTGRGRATEDATIELRNKIISREEAVSLVKKYDGEFPQKYFKDFLNHTNLDEEKFFEIIDKFRSPHLWDKINGKWVLKKTVWK